MRILTLLFLLSLEASAQNCPTVDSILDRGTDCESNGNFSHASRKCLEDFEAKIKANSAALALMMKTNFENKVEEVGAKQTVDFASSAENSKATAALTKQLIQDGKQRHKLLLDYLGNLNLPFKWPRGVPADDPEIEAELKETECFGPHEKSIVADLDSLEASIQQLEKVRDTVTSHGVVSSKREKKLEGSVSSPGSVSAPKPPQGPTVKKGPKKVESGVSGEKTTLDLETKK